MTEFCAWAFPILWFVGIGCCVKIDKEKDKKDTPLGELMIGGAAIGGMMDGLLYCGMQLGRIILGVFHGCPK